MFDWTADQVFLQIPHFPSALRRKMDFDDILDLLDDDDVLVLDLLRETPRKFPARRSIADIPDSVALESFRFRVSEIFQLRLLLHIPAVFDCGDRLHCSGDEALMILLARLATTKRKVDIAADFNRCPSSVSLIWNCLATYLRDTWTHVYKFNETRVTTNLQRYSSAIFSKGAPLDNVWGFIDGTCREIARPTKDQSLFYSGHKHYHNIKYQVIVTPNGLLSHLFGPGMGAQNDMGVFHLSCLEDLMSSPAFDNHVVFGDGGYATIGHLMSPIDKLQLSPDEAEYNEAFRLPRLRVEHGFMRVTQLFSMFQKPSLLRIRSCPVGLFYEMAVLFTNLRTCLDGGNQISSYFRCNPCSCEEFLGFVE